MTNRHDNVIVSPELQQEMVDYFGVYNEDETNVMKFYIGEIHGYSSSDKLINDADMRDEQLPAINTNRDLVEKYNQDYYGTWDSITSFFEDIVDSFSFQYADEWKTFNERDWADAFGFCRENFTFHRNVSKTGTVTVFCTI